MDAVGWLAHDHGQEHAHSTAFDFRPRSTKYVLAWSDRASFEAATVLSCNVNPGSSLHVFARNRLAGFWTLEGGFGAD